MRAMKRRVARSTDWLVGDRGGERTHKLFRIGSRFAPSENAERHGPARHTHTGHRTRCSGRARTKSMIACRCAKLQYDGYTTRNNTWRVRPWTLRAGRAARRPDAPRRAAPIVTHRGCPVVTVARCIYISIAIYIGVLYIRIVDRGREIHRARPVARLSGDDARSAFAVSRTAV